MQRTDSRRLGTHLKQLREDRRLTLGGVEVLSEGHGERINKSYLHRVERGKTIPSIPRLRILSKVYRVKLARLLEVLETAFEEQEREATLVEELAGLDFDELTGRGSDANKEGDFSRAAIIFRAALERTAAEEASSDRSEHVALAHYYLAIAFKNLGRLETAREHAELALETDGVSPERLNWIRVNLAVIYRHLGFNVLASEVLDGLFARQECLPKKLLATVHSAMGSVLLKSDPRKAAQHYRSALVIFRQLKEPFEECVLIHNVALAEVKSGNLERALKMLNRALELARKNEYLFWLSKAQSEIGRVLYLQGRNQEAKAMLRDANILARRREYYDQLFLNHFHLRKLHLEDGNANAAKSMESGLRFFATRIVDSFEELEEFKQELQAQKEEMR